jgi:hypothetical protein
MARIRSIKPEFWADRKLSRVSRDARLLYISLWNFADEHGRLQGDARYVKGHCLMYDDDLSLKDVDRLLDELQKAGRVVKYTVDSDPYLFLPKLSAHQRLEPDKSASRLPPPPDSERDPDSAQTSPSPAQIFSDESAPIVVQQVAGSRLQVAGSRGQVRQSSGTPRRSTTDQRVAEGLALAARYAEEDNT